MKKLAHVLVLPKLAGSQQFCLTLLSSLTEYDRYVLVSSSEDVDERQRQEFISRFEDAGVTIVWCKFLRRDIGFFDFKALAELYKIYKNYNFDIVHTNSTKPGIIGRIAAKFAGVNLIVHTVHGISFYKGQSNFKRFIYWLIEAIALQFGHINITVNKFYLKYYKCFFWKKNICIYNGILFPESTHFIDKYPLGAAKRLLFVGRLDSQKDPLTLLKAFSMVVINFPDLILDIVGDGELHKDCCDYVKINNLQSNVIIHGWLDDPSTFYANADIFICPSKYEAFGLIFLEAAFFKLPIISTQVEGIPEVVINDVMGFLVEPSNPQALADKIVRLLENPDLRLKFGEEGRNIVMEKFDKSTMIEAYRALYIKK